ncbi:MAG: XRE family transcriptional regulator [Clostridia bacterium]|nr:XRE family transcriptional regulator [Clostridia bacterium]
MVDNTALGKNIKKYREKMGITQTELAQRLFVSFQAISAWERGISLPDLENASMLADIFNVKLDTLLHDNDNNYFIAIDGGGTKTEFVLFEKSGRIIKRLVLDSTNPNSVGVEKSIDTLKKGIGELLNSSNAKYIFAGVSGVTTGNHIQTIQNALKECFGIPVTVDTDGTNLLAMAKDPANAAIVISGTGSVIFVRKNYERTRVGGWGYMFDQPGSAYSVGRLAVNHTLSVNDGFEPKSQLSSLVEEYLGGNVWQKLSNVYEKGVSYIASIAPIVVKAAENGDKTSQNILENEATELAKLIIHSKEKYGAPSEFLCAGGFINNEYFKNLVEKYSNTPLYKSNAKAVVYGACLECMRLAGEAKEKDFENNFNESYEW